MAAVPTIKRWLYDHQQALAEPRGLEAPIVRMREALVAYAREHETRWGSKIGDDYVIGEFWVQMSRGYLGLLNGETGRLDCGTLDAEMRMLALECGFTEEL